MDRDFTIYCVDDDHVNRRLIEVILKDYKCILFESGQACLDVIPSSLPDLILLDVVMPEMDGLQTCRNLRKHKQLSNTPIIFVSINDSLEERLQGYTAGGDDYIVKPFKPDELLAKVKASLNRKSILDSAQQASSTTFDIMSTMSEMSSVVHFLQSTFSCNTYDSLAKKIIQAHDSLGLEISIEFIINNETQYYCTAGIEHALEESVFEFVRNKGRLINSGKRAAVNYPNICILIRNMPIDNPDLHGRIRDHIAIIAQGADSKINTLKSELLIRSQRDDIINIMQQLKKAMTEIDIDYKRQQSFSCQILSSLGETLEESFITLGLTDEQENHQRKIIESAEDQTKELFNVGLSLKERFAGIIQLIHIAQNNSNIEETQIEDAPIDEIENESVTLF